MDREPLSKDSGFHVTAGGGSEKRLWRFAQLVGWNLDRRWPTLSEAEMPELPWDTIEGVRRLRKIEMLEWIHHGRHTHSSRRGPEDKPSPWPWDMNLRRQPYPANMKTSVVTLFCRSLITVGHAATEPGSLDSMGIIGSQEGGAKWQHIISKTRWAGWSLSWTSESKQSAD